MAICMAFLKLLLSSGLIFVATAAFIEENAKGETAVIPCFSDYVIPVNHNVELTLFVEKSSNGYCYAPFHLEAQQNDNNFALYGKSTVVVNITRPMRHIKLRLQQPQINGLIFVMNNKQKFQNGKIQKYSYDYDTQSYDLYFQSELLEGLYTIETDFVGGLNDIVGLSVFSYSNSEQERWIVAINDLQKIVAQLIFPCLDRSELKLNLTITIRHYIYNLVSNLKETKYTSENGIKSWQYHITSMTRNYLVFIVLKDFISVTHMEHKDIQIWYRKDLQWHIDYMWDIIYDVFKYLENKWLIKCSSPTMHIIIPNIKDGIMSPGLIFYREIDIMHSEGLDHEANQIRIKRLITQKLIYQCLSNTSSWLIDGLVTLIEVDIIDKLYKESRMLDLFVVQNQQESLHFDYHFNGKAIGEAGSHSEIDLLPSFPYYNKAPFILRMFRYIITDEIFREGVRKYVSRQAFHSTTTSNNFWTAMEDALDENLEPEYIHEHNINLRDTMIAWMKQKHYPVVSLIRDYYFGWVSVWLESYIQSELQELRIPLTFTSQTYPNFNRTSLDNVKWLRYKRTDWPRLDGFSINHKENGWIIANLQQSGYYRVNYDSENWNRITTYLNSEEYTNIHVLNRAQIIDDSFHLAIQKQQNFSLFWNLTRYLSRETDYIAWYPMFKALEYMSNIFPFQNRIVDDIKISLHKILGNLLATIGYHRQFNENIFTKYLRQEATKWACTLNHQRCLEEANNKLQQYFIHSERNILFPWWKEWTYCEGLKLADGYTWRRLLHKLLRKDSYIQKTNKTLEMLACPQDLNIIKEYLSLITSNMKNINILKMIEDFENIHIFHSIVAKHSNDFDILDLIFSNFYNIKPCKVSTIVALIDIINHVYSEEQLKKVSQFVIDKIKIEGSLSSYVEYKINLRSSQIEKQAIFLQLLKPAEDVTYIRH